MQFLWIPLSFFNFHFPMTNHLACGCTVLWSTFCTVQYCRAYPVHYCICTVQYCILCSQYQYRNQFNLQSQFKEYKIQYSWVSMLTPTTNTGTGDTYSYYSYCSLFLLLIFVKTTTPTVPSLNICETIQAIKRHQLPIHPPNYEDPAQQRFTRRSKCSTRVHQRIKMFSLHVLTYIKTIS